MGQKLKLLVSCLHPNKLSRPYRNGRTAQHKHLFSFLFLCFSFPLSKHRCIETCIPGPSKTAIISFSFLFGFSRSSLTLHKKHKGKTTSSETSISNFCLSVSFHSFNHQIINISNGILPLIHFIIS